MHKLCGRHASSFSLAWQGICSNIRLICSALISLLQQKQRRLGLGLWPLRVWYNRSSAAEEPDLNSSLYVAGLDSDPLPCDINSLHSLILKLSGTKD